MSTGDLVDQCRSALDAGGIVALPTRLPHCPWPVHPQALREVPGAHGSPIEMEMFTP